MLRILGLLHLLSCISSPVLSELIAPNALNLRITKNITHEIPSTIFGYMWEDINHSGDGGLYGELLQNRAFQGVIPGTQNALNAWQSYNGARLSVTSKTQGVSKALPNSLEVKIPKVATSLIGFENTGYWGIKVQEGWTYKGSLYAKSDSYNGPITVSLKSNRGTTFASQKLEGISSSWKKFEFQFKPTASAADENNVFNVVVDGSTAAGKTLHFGMFSLFPPTFKGRENGMRMDLAQLFADTSPGVWRFPGGNNLEGNSWDSRWKWNETIGPLEDRPGRVADWGYPNTDGLGLLEYLNWAEDLEAEPILGVWSGISTQNYSEFSTWPIVPEADLQPYIDDVLNEIEFIVGDANTTWGSVRASLGRTEPYALRFIEIGNEDQFQQDSYAAYRWRDFVDAIGAKFPQMEFLATSLPSLALDPPYQRIDFHQYNSPNWFIDNALFFDSYPRNNTKWFVGEYAVTSTNETNALDTLTNGRLAYPTLQGAVAEAAFMTGMERNSDVVFAASYAPSFQHIRSYQWTPDLVTYDAQRFVRSTSYYVQQMFSVNKGTHVLATEPTPSNDTAPLFWSASFNNETDVVYLKVSNTGETDLVANIFLDFASTGTVSAVSLGTPPLSPITGHFNISNTLEEPELITPTIFNMAIPFLDRFNYTFPATSVTILGIQSPPLN
ncbi:glycoside hydrolase [Dendrothele bispora CBS 962.96]|uniref:non-reducing end alpha-L-arabinofuranosidase n=1 Tax=Dendrothele bispora (strain CBS 962.96) TaxID=1314807 RepID=A0A4S8LK21_DENBC|nr:glycoside hydrolase [Dendrothele bispora CBS 962.96]